MQINIPSHLRWSLNTDKAGILKTGVHCGGASLPFSIGCRTDAMVVATKSKLAEEGAIVATGVYSSKARQPVFKLHLLLVNEVCRCLDCSRAQEKGGGSKHAPDQGKTASRVCMVRLGRCSLTALVVLAPPCRP